MDTNARALPMLAATLLAGGLGPVPIPADEADRIAAMADHDLLDPHAEPAFDRIAGLAAGLFDAPSSLVSLVLHDEQGALGACGADDRRVPRDLSFCARGILQDRPLLIPDTRKDPVFARHPLVVGGPGIRFYAGAQLRLGDRHRAGMLCVFDTRPRAALEDAACQRFNALADIASDMIRMRRGMLLAEASERRAGAVSRELARIAEMSAEQGLLLQATLDTVEIGIAVVDRDLRLAIANERYFQLSCTPPAARRIGAPFEEIVRGWAENGALLDGPLEEFVRARVEAAARRESIRAELPTRDGRLILVQRKPMPDGRFLVALTDVTEARMAERRKDEFVATVSHELRTPLTSISGSLGLLASGAAGPLEPRARRMVEIAETNSRRLVRLVNDILDIEKLGNAATEMRFAPLDLPALAAAAVEGLRGYADGLGVRLSVSPAPPDLPPVRGDADRLTQVVTNLVSNAARFSPPDGEVRIGFGAAPEGGVRLTVADRGPGIPAAFLPRLFQRFAQAETAGARAKGGTGLGLAIVQEILRRHGGTIAVETAEGEGTTFHVDLPAWRQRARDSEAVPRVLACGAAPWLAPLAEALRAAGFAMEGAADAADTVARAEAQARPAFILLPLGTGEALSLEAVALLRARTALRQVPLLLVAGEDGGVAALDLLDWLPPPLDIGQLAARIGELGAALPPPHRPRVLHLAAEEELGQLVAAGLARVAEVTVAPDLAAARRLLEAQGADVALLDLSAQDSDAEALLGELARRIGDEVRLPAVIIAETAAAGLADRLAAAMAAAAEPPAEVAAALQRMAASRGQPA